MDPVIAVQLLGGVAPFRRLRDQGVSRHHLERAVARGALFRVRPGWFCTIDADPALRAAVEIGAVISCVSLADRRGLWTFTGDVAHLAADPHSSLRRPTSAHVHRAAPVMPREPFAIEDSLVNALVLMAACRPYEEALAAWESAIRQDLVDLDVLRGLPLGPAARRILDDVRPFADSGLESIVVPRLRWLRLPLRRQIHIAGHPVDLLIGDRLILQIDGGTHVDAQRMADNEHDARLRLMGYHVIRVGYWQILHDWATVQDLIVTAVAQGLHRAKR